MTDTLRAAWALAIGMLAALANALAVTDHYRAGLQQTGLLGDGPSLLWPVLAWTVFGAGAGTLAGLQMAGVLPPMRSTRPRPRPVTGRAAVDDKELVAAGDRGAVALDALATPALLALLVMSAVSTIAGGPAWIPVTAAFVGVAFWPIRRPATELADAS